MMDWSFNRFQLTLTGLWWGWGLLLFLLLVALSSQSAIFGDDASAAWQWFLPNITPSMGLVGAASYARRKTADVEPAVIKPLFLMAAIVSAVYLLLLTVSLLGVFFSTDPLAWLGKSSLWLGPLQGLAASALAVFFAK